MSLEAEYTFLLKLIPSYFATIFIAPCPNAFFQLTLPYSHPKSF